MSDHSKIYGAFRPEGASITIHCSSPLEIAYSSGNFGQVIDGNAQTPRIIDTRSLLARTTVEHELRHYHDFLLSTTFIDVFRRKIQMSANFSSLIPILRSASQSKIVYPFVGWQELDDDRRQARLSSLCAFYGFQRNEFYEIPVFSLEQLDSEPSNTVEGLWHVMLRDALSIQRIISGLTENLHEYFSPAEVYEVGAVATQFRAMVQLVGSARAYDVYEKTILKSYYGRLTRLLLGFVNFPFDRNHSESWFDFLSTVSFWCIAGGAPDIGPKESKTIMYSCPAYRMGKLLSKLFEERPGLHHLMRKPKRLLDYFDSLCSDTPTVNRLHGTSAWLRMKYDSWLELDKGVGQTSSVFKAGIAYYRFVFDQREKLIQLFESDPDKYLQSSYQLRHPKELEFPLVIMDYSNINLEAAEVEFGNLEEAGFLGLESQLGEQVHWWISDELEKIKLEVQTIDGLGTLNSKLFFDDSVSPSPAMIKSIRWMEREVICKSTYRHGGT